MDKLVSYIVRKISQTNPEFSELDVKKMEYGLLCFFDEITKVISFFIIFYLFSLQQYYVVTFMFFCPVRLFSGGYHAKTYWGCFIMSLLIFFMIIAIGKNFIFGNVVHITIMFISLLLIFIFSPVDNINKRIKSNERRLKLKYLSIVITITLCGLTYILPIKYLATGVTSILAAVLMMLFGSLNNKLESKY